MEGCENFRQRPGVLNPSVFRAMELSLAKVSKSLMTAAGMLGLCVRKRYKLVEAIACLRVIPRVVFDGRSGKQIGPGANAARLTKTSHPRPCGVSLRDVFTKLSSISWSCLMSDASTDDEELLEALRMHLVPGIGPRHLVGPFSAHHPALSSKSR